MERRPHPPPLPDDAQAPRWLVRPFIICQAHSQKYTPFLNHCTELRFMSAIMGGYVFRHSLWQEHFAAKLKIE